MAPEGAVAANYSMLRYAGAAKILRLSGNLAPRRANRGTTPDDRCIDGKRKLFLSIPQPKINLACILVSKIHLLVSSGGTSGRLEPSKK